MDRIAAEKRSRIMRAVRKADTKPELRVRKAAHRLGYRFRLHRDDLPGTPDLVFPRYALALFVHGCFWHQHQGCHLANRPSSNKSYWTPKLERNMERDSETENRLTALGWRVRVIWECETHRGDLPDIVVRAIHDC